MAYDEMQTNVMPKEKFNLAFGLTSCQINGTVKSNIKNAGNPSVLFTMVNQVTITEIK